jgi:hypothetical protein
MGSKQWQYSIEPYRSAHRENIMVWLAESTPKAADRKLAEAVWAYLRKADGQSILLARATADRLRTWGIDAEIDEPGRTLKLSDFVHIPIYTRDELLDRNRAENGPQAWIDSTDELILDEVDLACALYTYCFGEPLDNPHGLGLPRTAWRRCMDRFHDAIEGTKRYGLGVNADGGNGTEKQRYMEVPKEIFDGFMGTGFFQRVQ